MKKQLSNFFKVRRRIPQAENRAIGCKWGGSHYAVVFHGEADEITPENTPAKDNIGECNSLMGLDTYNAIKKQTEKTNSKYYDETNASYNLMQTEATVAVVQNSAVVYSMLCTIYRSQTGYLSEDVEGRKLGPILFNHSWHHTNSSDWEAGNSNFAIVVSQDAVDTQQEMVDGHYIDFSDAISNESWNHTVKDVLKSIRLPIKVKELCEHLFTTVFMDPDAAYNPSFVVLHPASGWIDYSPEFNGTSLLKLNATTRALNGYDKYDENNGFTDPDSQSSYSDIRDYFSAFSTYIDRMLNLFPQMDEVLEELQFVSDSNFDFTRDLDHQTLLIVDSENISDLIQSTAFAPFVDDEMGDYNESLADMLHASPVIARDKERSHYGANLSYRKAIDIDTDGSYELFLQGKVIPLEYIYFEYHDSQEKGEYVYTYLVPRELNSWDEYTQAMKVTLINSVLADTGAIVPIYNIVQTSMNNTTYGTYVTPRPTINCFYKSITDISVIVEEAQDSFYINKKE